VWATECRSFRPSAGFTHHRLAECGCRPPTSSSDAPRCGSRARAPARAGSPQCGRPALSVPQSTPKSAASKSCSPWPDILRHVEHHRPVPSRGSPRRRFAVSSWMALVPSTESVPFPRFEDLRSGAPPASCSCMHDRGGIADDRNLPDAALSDFPHHGGDEIGRSGARCRVAERPSDMFTAA